MKTGLFCQVFITQLENWTFNIQMAVHHSKTGIVQYFDPHCMPFDKLDWQWFAFTMIYAKGVAHTKAGRNTFFRRFQHVFFFSKHFSVNFRLKSRKNVWKNWVLSHWKWLISILTKYTTQGCAVFTVKSTFWTKLLLSNNTFDCTGFNNTNVALTVLMWANGILTMKMFPNGLYCKPLI